MNYLAICAALASGHALVFGFSELANPTAAIPVKPSEQVQPMKPESDQESPDQQSGAKVTQAKSTSKRVGFRLKDWKTVHTHSAQDAQETVATLKKIGCDVKSENHGNHVDVRYRCPEWKSMRLTTDQLVNQWTTWCAAKGMETVVVNPSATTKKPTVKFRLAAKRTIHLHDSVQTEQILNTLKLIGCDVSSHQHGDHMDVTFKCPQWITIELPSEAKAFSWQKWLKESGFETQPSH